MPTHDPSFGKVLEFPLRQKKTRPLTVPLSPAEVASISSARLAMFWVIGSEAMLFAGLLAVYASLRFGSFNWPPAHLYLPIKITWVNSTFLFFSCYTMWQALIAGRANNQVRFVSLLSITGRLGVLFLCIQGYEWIQILQEGVMTKARIYGSAFYLLIGCHALHVFGAVVWLWIVIHWAKHGQLPSSRFVRAELCGMYWYFVGAVWAVIFPLVYLS
ncbi:MAG: heme-copper oxidase subunit III [Deltaproteobacteria bacterium]|nr:heme-copper oxidase subunit III [Deltaproteobacteria bacterium]